MDRRRLLALSGALAVGSLAGCVSSLSSDEDPTARADPGVEPEFVADRSFLFVV